MTDIPPATEDDLKLDLEAEYKSHAGPYPSLIELLQAEEPLAIIRLAHHHQQEAERRTEQVNSTYPVQKRLRERITTLEKQLDTAESALDDYTDKALRLEGALREIEKCLGNDRDVVDIIDRALTEVSDTEENPTKHEYRRCPMCGRCAECGEENPTDD